jgi:hypothetical protein
MVIAEPIIFHLVTELMNVDLSAITVPAHDDDIPPALLATAAREVSAAGRNHHASGENATDREIVRTLPAFPAKGQMHALRSPLAPSLRM